MASITGVTEADLIFLVGGELRSSGSDENAFRRVTEHLGQLLSLPNVIVLFGSGASFHLRAPSIRGLTIELISEMVSEFLPGVTLDSSDQHILASMTHASAGNINLETCLSTLNSTINYGEEITGEGLNINNKMLSIDVLIELRKKLNAALTAACDLSARAATLEEPLKSDPWRVHSEFFRKLLYARRDFSATHAFTTNYDLSIEYALDTSGVDYIDGFKGTVIRSFHPEIYSQALYFAPETNERRVVPVPRWLYYYKLHGSINWRFAKSAEGMRTVVQRSEPVWPSEELAVIYPTQDKEMETLGYPYADLFRVFGDLLQTSDVGIISVGYGFHDEHVNRMLDAALRTNYSLQLFLIDPKNILSGYDATQKTASFASSPLSTIAQRKDARISCITGSEATFERLASQMMPDVERETFVKASREKGAV